MHEKFRTVFGAAPATLVHAPGRVNLIGEHIDYSDLAVLPIAIDRAIHLAVRPRADGRVRIVNADFRYGSREFDTGPPIEPYPTGDWGNYPKAALQGLADLGVAVRGFDAWMEGDLPPAAGLSSSSAMVVASALAGLAAAGETDRFSPLELAGHMAQAERYVGVHGGGMDQAAILGGRAGCALRVDFAPLEVRPIPIPAGWRFIVAHSLEAAEKSGSARAAYNARRADVEEAARRVAFHLGETEAAGGPETCRTLVRGWSPAELLDACAAAGLPDRLTRRFRHVATEAARVAEAVAALESDSPEAFGDAMVRSHESLRTDFDVSTPALDELASLALGAGASGARLTGAGFGGCVVALVAAERVEEVTASLDHHYYAGRIDIPAYVRPFLARPSGPARTEPA